MIRKLRRLDYEGPIAGGRHSRMVHPDSGKDVSVGLIRAIMREIDVTLEEWLEL